MNSLAKELELTKELLTNLPKTLLNRDARDFDISSIAALKECLEAHQSWCMRELINKESC